MAAYTEKQRNWQSVTRKWFILAVFFFYSHFERMQNMKLAPFLGSEKIFRIKKKDSHLIMSSHVEAY